MEITKGHRFGRLKVVGFCDLPIIQKGIICICDCGEKKIALLSHVKHGLIRSCGCLRRDVAIRMGKSSRTHGEGNCHGTKKESDEWRCWKAMRQRCRNPKHVAYYRYGGRGIKVCRRWSRFENFLKDMGRKPSPKHSIDRINNNGNYEPKNCRWATIKEQAANRG